MYRHPSCLQDSAQPCPLGETAALPSGGFWDTGKLGVLTVLLLTKVSFVSQLMRMVLNESLKTVKFRGWEERWVHSESHTPRQLRVPALCLLARSRNPEGLLWCLIVVKWPLHDLVPQGC